MGDMERIQLGSRPDLECQTGDRVILPVGGITLTYPTHPMEQAELCCGYNHCAFLMGIQ